MNIRRGGVITVITLLSVFFIFMSYALIIGWGGPPRHQLIFNI